MLITLLPFILFQVSSYLLIECHETQIFLEKHMLLYKPIFLNASIHPFLIHEFEIAEKEKNSFQFVLSNILEFLTDVSRNQQICDLWCIWKLSPFLQIKR